MALWPNLAPAILMLAVVGAANSVEDVAAFTLLQRIVPNELLTRVLGVLWALAMVGSPWARSRLRFSVNLIGARAAFVAVGAILPLLALVTYSRLGEIDRAVAPAPELALIEQVPMFAPLSCAAKERVAANLVPLSVQAGELVIRAGDVGDRFYIVGDGELDIVADGLHKTAHQADYFGEIALLRDVPRTATVTATVDSELYALQRDDFLEAVTGVEAAHAPGHAVAENGWPSSAADQESARGTEALVEAGRTTRSPTRPGAAGASRRSCRSPAANWCVGRENPPFTAGFSQWSVPGSNR